MKRFIKELRRREVFRTAGLYVGICWILIEVASVVLPAFDAPEWLFRGAIVAVIAGFPVMLALAWFLDVSAAGISRQADPTDTIVEQLGVRKSDFAIIGVLALALVVSLSLNLTDETPVNAELEPVSVLVTAFTNATGEPLFNNALEDALIVGLEVAPHIAVFDGRDNSAQENMDILVAGSVHLSGNEFSVVLEGTEISSGQTIFKADERAVTRDAVLDAIGELTATARKKLGDRSRKDSHLGHASYFVAGSLDAAHAYALARRFEVSGDLESAARHYEQAAIADSNLGRAFSGLALTEFALGREDQAAKHWETAQSLSGTMTEREQLRAMGRYSASVALDSDAALKIYSEFVNKYPADIGAKDHYASALFQQLDFAGAVDEISRVVSALPADPTYRLKLALYSMYTGDWEVASTEGERAIAADPDVGAAYLPVAIAALSRGQPDQARDAYQRMARSAVAGNNAAVAELGLADIDLYLGQVSAAQERLKVGVSTDIEHGNHRLAALKYIALAQSYVEQDNYLAATSAAASAVSLGDGIESRVPAAMIYLQTGDPGSAKPIIDELAAQSDAHSRAYAQMLRGMVMESEGAQTEAIIAMRAAIATADLWLIRYQTGKAYLRAESYPQALDEFTLLGARRGEATSVFLNHIPTYRLLAELPYWTGRAHEALGMGPAARASYAEYVALRPHGGALADDASIRAANLE